MTPWLDNAVFDWIEHGRAKTKPRDPTGPVWGGNTVKHLMPDVFEAYAKVFHWLDAHYGNIDTPLSPEEQTALHLPQCEPLRDLVEKLRANDGDTRVRWKAVAEALGIPFEAGLSDDWFRAKLETGCWPRYILGPDEGLLDLRELSALSTVLAAGDASIQCFYRLPEMAFIGTDNPLLYEGSLADLSAFSTKPSFRNPEYWWPANHEWCVCSDYDLAFTIVGGSSAAIRRVLGDPVLEAIEVQPDLRVDYYAPMP
jgi:hypothetical protein